MKRAWVEVNLDNLAENYRYIRRKVPKQTQVLSIVKANAYGCGEIDITTELVALGTDWLGVASIEEAITIRDAAPETPILVFGFTPVNCVRLLNKYNITQTVMSLEYACMLQEYAQQNHMVFDVHLKLNTGMNRIGLDCCTEEGKQKTLDACDLIYTMSGLRVGGVYTHMPSSYGFVEDDLQFTKHEFDLFCEMIEEIRSRGHHVGLRHCATSAACINYPEFALDMVRPGSALYGIITDKYYLEKTDFRPVISLRAIVVQVKDIYPGQTISYGRTYNASSHRRIATISAGFADGVQRRLNNNGKVLICGTLCDIVGIVCMDFIMADVTDVPEVEAGTIATFIGEDGENAIAFEDWESTIGCGMTEALCTIPGRAIRIYIRNGKPTHFTRYTRKEIAIS